MAHFCLTACCIPVSQTTLPYLYCPASTRFGIRLINAQVLSPCSLNVLVGSSVAQCLSTEPAACFLSRWNTPRRGPQSRPQIPYRMHRSINILFKVRRCVSLAGMPWFFQKHAPANSRSVMRDCVLAWLWSVQQRRLDCPTPRSLPYEITQLVHSRVHSPWNKRTFHPQSHWSIYMRGRKM